MGICWGEHCNLHPLPHVLPHLRSHHWPFLSSHPKRIHPEIANKNRSELVHGQLLIRALQHPNISWFLKPSPLSILNGNGCNKERGRREMLIVSQYLINNNCNSFVASYPSPSYKISSPKHLSIPQPLPLSVWMGTAVIKREGGGRY